MFRSSILPPQIKTETNKLHQGKAAGPVAKRLLSRCTDDDYFFLFLAGKENFRVCGLVQYVPPHFFLYSRTQTSLPSLFLPRAIKPCDLKTWRMIQDYLYLGPVAQIKGGIGIHFVNTTSDSTKCVYQGIISVLQHPILKWWLNSYIREHLVLSPIYVQNVDIKMQLIKQDV